VPYSQAQLCEVIDTLLNQLTVERDAVTLANRRYAAANARYTKLAKQTGKHIEEEQDA